MVRGAVVELLLSDLNVARSTPRLDGCYSPSSPGVQVDTKQIKWAGLGLLATGVVGAAVVLLPSDEQDSTPKDELEELTEEFIDIKCSRGTSAEQASVAETRTKEIMERIKEIRDSKEDSVEQQELDRRLLDLIQTDCSNLD